MDFYFFQLINNLTGRFQLLDFFGIFCANYLIFVIILVVAFLLIIYKNEDGRKSYRKIALMATIASGLSYLVKIIIHLFYLRPRPFVVYDIDQLIDKSADGSFPSMHTTLAFIFAFAIYFYNKKLGIIFLILAALVGLGRIYVGVHYPSDVLGGILLGFLSVYFVKKIPLDKFLKV